MRFSILAILPMVAFAGCAQESHQAPVSTAFGGMGPTSTEPEPANSLPRGAAVDGALTGRNVSTTLIQPGLEFRLGWSGRLCGIELSEAAGFLV